MNNKEFRINKDRKTVVARMSEVPTTICDETRIKCSNETAFVVSNMDYRLGIDITSNSSNPHFTAKAVCTGDDDFDLCAGIEIAASKCDLKYHNSMQKRYERIAKYLFKAMEEIMDLRAYHEKKALNIQNDIKRNYIEKRVNVNQGDNK